MSTMVERPEIPEHIWEAARSLRSAVLWESNSSVEHIASAILAAEKRGKEEAAKIAEAYDPHGKLKHRGTCVGIAAAIRGS